MRKILSAVLLLALAVPSVFAGELDSYIEKLTSNEARLLKNGTFRQGIIFYPDGDSLQTELFCFSERKESYHYIFIVERSDDSIRVIRPDAVLGYKMDGESYKSFSDGEVNYFIRRIDQGRIDLYERGSIPYDDRFLYFMDFSFNNDFFVLDPSASNFARYMEAAFHSDDRLVGTNGGNRFTAVTNGNIEKFNYFISGYLQDCEEIRALVLSEVLTIWQLPRIVRVYNTCQTEQ